jgi:CRISPR-associated endonuclease/helicase Cas3
MVPSYNFESHPGVPLKDHLRIVGRLCKDKARNIISNDDKFITTANIIGLTHDFGKYTRYFQNMLRNESKRNRELNRELSSHAPLSSLYTAWLINKYINDPFLTAASMLCVYRHHGKLDIRLGDLHCKVKEIVANNNYKKQVESIIENKDIINEELKDIGLYSIDEFVNDIDKGFNEVKKVLFNYQEYIKRDEDEINAFCRLYKILLLFSLLIDSDKKTASDVKEPDRKQISTSVIYDYISNIKRSNILDDLRSEIRNDVLSELERLIHNTNNGLSKKILSINAPTGAGKTLLSISVALRLRDELYRKEGKLYRIIYVLPYINIIEQTYDVFKKAFCLKREDYSMLLKHHHLYIPDSKDFNEGRISNDELLMLAESWDSEIIVTTLVQFMETLIGTRNRMLKKFHKLYNSIIILDEIQTIPLEYWRLVRSALLALSRYSYIIFMTATKPNIFKDGEYVELVTNAKSYFRRLDRVRYIVRDDITDIEKVVELVKTLLDNTNSILIIVNKIKTSIVLYNELRGELPSINLEYLSTNIIPKHRKARIDNIRDVLKNKGKIVVVSTQLVEAGVDLDFDVVIRDIGPFDSIIQAAGRCNRNWNNNEHGQVYITNIHNEGKSDAETIYGTLTIDIVKEILKKIGKNEFYEREISDIIDDYFKEVEYKLNTSNSSTSTKYIYAIRELDFSELIKFKMIKEQPKIPIFIEIDNDACNIRKDFINAMKINKDSSVYDNMYKLRSLRIKLEEYIVNSWKDLNVGNMDKNIEYIKYIPKDDIDRYYCIDTGLRIDSGDEGYYII